MAPTALTDLPTSTWTNWVGNQSFTPAFAAAPGDEEEVAALVRQAAERGAGVRVVGAGHSFTPVVRPTGCCSTSRRCAAS
jgi:FAD/FMN-containing dehydrogenase